MKALSIRQPWAWAIVHAGKRFENRDWKRCSYRGPLLIHAAKGCTRDEYSEAADFIAQRRCAATYLRQGVPPLPPLNVLHRGGIVGVCRVVNATTFSPDPWFFGPLGIHLADVRPLPFVPFKGSLGLFDVPDLLLPPEAFQL